MSTILSLNVGFGNYQVFCQSCREGVGVMSAAELGELSSAGVKVQCFDCDGWADLIPKQLWYQDDTFLLGIGGLSFLASWEFGGLDCEPEALSLKPITTKLWYTLKTGDIRILSIKPTLSSSPKVITIDLKEAGKSE